ncbi:uncharacterized protein LOC127527071 [Erpetoichthys calabaricus]|uniref:uncharacterized protein LOC127527071 n=1 Tax=Erpetoichthys calabaricus TaxID=27687 RepID=UPI002233F03E|nr:uncharacterized protein LOC127527071 [Erpetoichthys calabaricus]
MPESSIIYSDVKVKKDWKAWVPLNTKTVYSKIREKGPSEMSQADLETNHYGLRGLDISKQAATNFPIYAKVKGKKGNRNMASLSAVTEHADTTHQTEGEENRYRYTTSNNLLQPLGSSPVYAKVNKKDKRGMTPITEMKECPGMMQNQLDKEDSDCDSKALNNMPYTSGNFPLYAKVMGKHGKRDVAPVTQESAVTPLTRQTDVQDTRGQRKGI